MELETLRFNAEMDFGKFELGKLCNIPVGLFIVLLFVISVISITMRRRRQHNPSESLNSKHFVDHIGRGRRFNYNVPLSKYTRFRVGGPAEVLFRPSDLEDLVSTLMSKPRNLSITPIGLGSNLLVRDGGVPGMVVLLSSKAFQKFKVLENLQVKVGAGLSQVKLSKLCAIAGIGGFEFFCGIPGTVGGALRMNAGAHGLEVKDILISADVVDPHGSLHCLSVSELKYSYRHCTLPEDWTFVSAKFQGRRENPNDILLKIDSISRYREESQPVNEKTAGCTFANTEGGVPAWQLIQEAGCQGMLRGGAQVSTKHCNFIINSQLANAEDIEVLAEIIRSRVRQHSGFLLKWEVKKIGIPLSINN